MTESAINNVEKKIRAIDELEGWSKNKAEVSIASAKYDLDIAREALQDRNIPSVERAIARIEAALIESNPDNAMNEENSGFVIEKFSIYTLRRRLGIKPAEDESIPLLDLTELNNDDVCRIL